MLDCFNMADVMYVQDEDGESSDEASGDMHETEVRDSSQDDYLPPLIRLEKYASSENMYNRQNVGRVALETLRSVADSPEDVRSAMDIINRAAKDCEVSVRAELMEQLPHIAMLCHEEREKLHFVIQEYLLPLVIKFLGDSDNQVRKTTQAALIVLMEQGLIEMRAVEELVCPVILMLTELNSLVDFHTGAVALMSKMAPLIGRNATERLFMHRFAALCSDPVFYVRKVCATNFGEFCSVVGTRPTEEFLLPHFVELCGDAVWGVRKACAEVFMSVSCTCSLETRKNTLAPVFGNLLADQSRWVRMSAFQALGPFISTFADLGSSGLAYNQHGELVLLNSEDHGSRLHYEKESEWQLPSESGVTNSSSEEQGDSSLNNPVLNDVEVTHPDCDGDHSSVICCVCDTQSAVVPSVDATSTSVTVVNTEHSGETVYSEEVCSAPATNCDTCTIENLEADSYGVKICTSGPVNSDSLGTSCSPEDFNAFQFWRFPIPELDIDISLDICEVKNESEKPATSESSTSVDVGLHYEMENLTSRLEQGFLKDGVMKGMREKIQICTASVAVIRESEKLEAANVTVQYSASTQSTYVPKPLVINNSYNGACDNTKRVNMKAFEAKEMEDDHLNSGLGDGCQIPVVPSSPPTQDIVPQLLIDHFVSMTHPSQAQDTDNEITHYCAFSIPAVALTLGRANWNLIKKAYEALAADVQWKVRRTVAASIHELAVILGEELATKDLVPVFNGFIKDLDEVRIGALKHLADFLKLLKPTERNSYLLRFSDFNFTDNECNWRFREELAEQLLQSVELFSPEDTREHITPLAISLLMDKVAAVRKMALYLVTQLVHHVSSDPNLVRSLLAELAEQFAHNEHWNRRQTFALLCSRLLSEQVLSDEDFARDVFPHLLDLSNDRVPNVRLAVARTLSCDLSTHSFFSRSENPHSDVLMECLQRLENDRDRDVKYFASLYGKSCTSSEYLEQWCARNTNGSKMWMHHSRSERLEQKVMEFPRLS